ncbi:MAG: DUF5107 domain-containing protein [Candidatus Firestonebacteria bacterium]
MWKVRTKNSKAAAVIIFLVLFFLGRAGAAVTLTEENITFDAYDYSGQLYPSTIFEGCFPYDRLDYNKINWSKKTGRQFKQLLLENEYLKIILIPEIGGRIHRAVYKPSGADMFFKNEIIKPAILYGNTGSNYMFVTGGLKYAFPSCGHSPNNLTPWQYEIINNPDKSISVLTYDTDRETNMKISVKTTLRPGSSLIELETKLENPTPYKKKYVYWICAAFDQNDEVEFVYPTDRMILHGSGWGPRDRTVISWPVFNKDDYSKFSNWDISQGLFPLGNKNNFVGAYDHGKQLGIARIYPPETVPGIKLWCFEKYGDILNNYTDNGSIYYEIFGGRAETQDEYLFLEPGQTVTWTEYWYPVSGTEGFFYANKEFAVNLKKVKEKGLLLGLASTSEFKGLSLKLFTGEKEIFSASVNVTPALPAKLTIPVSLPENTFISIIGTFNGKEVLKTGVKP